GGIALIDFDQGLNFTAVIAPVCAHQRRGGVGHGDSLGAPEIFVQLGGVLRSVLFLRSPGQSPYAATGPDQIAVAVGETQAALIGEHGRESSPVMKQVVRFLDDPPEVLNIVTGVVVGDGGVVELGRVDGITVEVPNRSIEIAVKAEITV